MRRASQHDSTAVDLYGGVGFFTLPMAKLFDRVTLVEGSPLFRALRAHERPRVEREGGRSAGRAAHERGSAKRTSCFSIRLAPAQGRKVIAAVDTRTMERIAYLSCDPVTFARDAIDRVPRKGYGIAGEIRNDFFRLRADGLDDVRPCPGARRIEEDEVHLRESAYLLLHRRGDDFHVLRHVHARVANGVGRALDHRHALEEPRDRQGEEPDAAVEVDRGLPVLDGASHGLSRDATACREGGG